MVDIAEQRGTLIRILDGSLDAYKSEHENNLSYGDISCNTVNVNIKNPKLRIRGLEKIEKQSICNVISEIYKENNSKFYNQFEEMDGWYEGVLVMNGYDKSEKQRTDLVCFTKHNGDAYLMFMLDGRQKGKAYDLLLLSADEKKKGKKKISLCYNMLNFKGNSTNVKNEAIIAKLMTYMKKEINKIKKT